MMIDPLWAWLAIPVVRMLVLAVDAARAGKATCALPLTQALDA
jgi:hypothetical protein